MLGIPVIGGYLIAGALVVGTAGGFYTGMEIEANYRDAKDLKTVKVEVAAVHQEEIKFSVVSTALETKLEEYRLVTLTINKQVDQIVADPLYARACFDDIGLRLANQALSAAPADPGGPRPALSVTVVPGRRDGSVDPAQAGGNQ